MTDSILFSSKKIPPQDETLKIIKIEDIKLPPLTPSTLPKPLVARINIWTNRNDGKLKKVFSTGHDSSTDNSDDDDDDDSDEDTGANKTELYDKDMGENAQLEQKLIQANLPEHVKKIADKELHKLRHTPSYMSDHAATRGYLELIAELPWNVVSQETIDLRKSKRDLDNDHYGMQKLKDRVLQYLAVRKLKQGQSGRTTQPILMFVGPPGTGKTSIAQSIANSIGRKFQRISLGGIADQSAIRGHRRTYIASMPGRIISGIRSVGVGNPVFLLDEIDKMTVGPQGDPAGALLEVLDPEQNHTFTDHYLNVAFDLSKVMFIATANSIENIPCALLDRMEVIQIPGYTHEEKFNIARRHLVPKQVSENALEMNMLMFEDDAIHKIISNYAREAGVRTLERKIGTICRVVAVEVVESRTPELPNVKSQSPKSITFPIIIDAASLDKYLGPVIFDRESSGRCNVPGVATGLAWTATGGEITYVEAEIMQGSKKEALVLTGQLGSVMRESAMLALNWIRANFHHYDALPSTLGLDLVENTVHIHFPAGAVGKDGPSAGVTIIVALMSLCSNISVLPDLAMTGEITLRGVVLKVGGVKSKILAAHRAGIKQVILPARNESDLADLPPSVKDKMKFHLVSTIDEVIRIAFDGKLLAKNSMNTIRLTNSSGLTSKL